MEWQINLKQKEVHASYLTLYDFKKYKKAYLKIRDKKIKGYIILSFIKYNKKAIYISWIPWEIFNKKYKEDLGSEIIYILGREYKKYILK